jgi:hypothetical protein
MASALLFACVLSSAVIATDGAAAPTLEQVLSAYKLQAFEPKIKEYGVETLDEAFDMLDPEALMGPDIGMTKDEATALGAALTLVHSKVPSGTRSWGGAFKAFGSLLTAKDDGAKADAAISIGKESLFAVMGWDEL